MKIKSKSYHVNLEGCLDHPEGCYLRVSEKGSLIVADFNSEGTLVGLEVLGGLKSLIASRVVCDKGEG